MASIEFWGGVGTVTGSKYLVESGKSRVLVDCGLFQGLKELRERNWQEPPFDPRSLNAVLITHAHIDHTGYLPRLVKQGFSGPVYCSPGTADLLKILLPDSGRLQEEDADFRNRHHITKHKPALPLYTEKDAYASLELLEPVANTGEPIEVAPGIRAGFRVAGHILGSSLVLLELDQAGADGRGRRVLFSGDLGHYDQPIIRDPVAPPACDYLLVESTYGDRLHDPEDPKVALARIINDAAKRNAPVLMCDEVHAQHLRSNLARFVGTARQLHAAAFAAAARVNLRFHHHYFAAQFLRSVIRLLRRARHNATRHRHAILSQKFFSLILMNLHATASNRI